MGLRAKFVFGLVCSCVFVTALSRAAAAATIAVPAGGNFQTALNNAQPGDVITLEAGATFTGNFILPNKGSSTDYITIRSSAADSALPPAGVRMTPAYASVLPKIRSSNSVSALRTATAAHHWKLMFLEFQANDRGYGDIISLGAGDSTQTQLSQVPYSLVLDRLYVHGDPQFGQKRGIAVHSSDTTIVNSYVSECKAVGQDTQAISGFNGPGNYVIENNYLEAATENFLLGGADPTIPNLVTTNVTFRHNYLSKPLAWRNPIIATPTGVSATAAPGSGSLAAASYFYKVVARTDAGQTNKASSVPSAEVTAAIPSGMTGGVTIAWTPVVGATEYVIFGRSSGGENMYWKTTATFFTDTGAAGTSGTPGSATKWAVKNIFELKNAQDVLVEGNVFENLWVADQPGYPIVFTPRDQNGTAPWVVVQRVTFRHNIVRHTAGGVNVLGTDNLAPSQRTNHITVADNLFDDLTSATWGSGSRPFQLGDGPDAITIDHNTIISTDSTILWLYGGSATSPTAITNAVYTNNMSAHNTYGIFGSNFSSGTTSINAYMPGAIVTRNVLAGGTASKYPTGNFFPTVLVWQGGFVDYSAGNYRLVDTSAYKNAATDGTDLGIDVDRVTAETANAVSGDNRISGSTSNVQIVTTTLPNGVVNQGYAQTLTCTGGSGACVWQVRSASLPVGIAFDPVAAVVSGTPSTVQTGLLSVDAYDPAQPTNVASATLSLTIDPPPFVLTLPVSPAARVGAAYELTPSLSGTMGTASWSIPSGALPDGIGIDAQSGRIAGVPAVWGTFTAVVQAQDSWGTGRTDAKPLTISVQPSALVITSTTLDTGFFNTPYAARLTASGGSGSAQWSMTGGALPSGLTFAASGLVSGTPTTVGTFSIGVHAIDANWPTDVATATVTLAIGAPPFLLSMPAAPAARVGVPLSFGGTTTGQMGTVSWKLASGTLPPGVTLNAATGVIAGTPQTFGSFNAIVQAADSYDATRVASAPVSISVAPNAIAISTTTLPAGNVKQPYSATLAATGGTGATVWSITAGSLPAGLQLSSNGVISGTPTTVGTSAMTVQASDAAVAGNIASQALALTVGAREIVLYASDASAVAGTWSLVRDTSAAGGSRVSNPDRRAAKLVTALASPANYFEMTFQAEAGVPYHVWMRGKADKDYWGNDSVMLQFSSSTDASGQPTFRIGTTSGSDWNLEDCSGCGLSGWGWQDNGWGVNVLGPDIYFATAGMQTIRVQVKEDGLSIDQVVLSANKYKTAAPGALKNDTTILPR